MGFIDISPNFGDQTQNLLPFVILILLVWGLSVYYSYRRFGAKRTLIYFLPTIIITMFIESAGVAGGRYDYHGYLIYVSIVGGAVPLSIVIAWSANFFILLNMGKHIVSRFYEKINYLQIVLISLIAGLFGVLLDFLEDPIAQHNHWWIWKESLPGLRYYGVPLSNFLGWFLLLFFMTFATIMIERSKISENRKVLLSISSLAITGCVVFLVHFGAIRLFEIIGLS
jgi:uncharacterized membrane protein